MRHNPDNLRPLEGSGPFLHPPRRAPEGRGRIRCVLIGGAIGLSLYPMSWGAAMLIQYIGVLW